MESAGAQVLRPVDSFFKVCMGSLGHQSQGEEIAQKLGLIPVAEEEKKAFCAVVRRGVSTLATESPSF